MRLPARLGWMFCFAFASAIASMPARAQDSGTDLFGPETLSVNGDIRLVAVDGGRGWLDGGYGKARFGSDGALRVRPEPVEANLVWQPRIGWALTGTVVATAQHGQQHAVDLSEAFVTYKPLLGQTRIAVRAGLFWPPVSLEHSGSDWHVTETITPSAINAWIGEEVKLGGVEATASVPLGAHRVAATLAVFGWNDTAGTLLALRGWAVHDEKATAFGLQPLPPQVGFMSYVQAPETRPVLELDHRPGWYAKLSWSPSQALELQALHYDNRGNPEIKTPAKQWGWDTDFDQLAAVVALAPVELKAQAMRGRTRMGITNPATGAVWVDAKFQAAYVMATHHFARGSVSLRAEAFGTRNAGSKLGPAWDEDGWAFTGAVRRELGPHVSLLGEVAHIDSRKDARATIGLAPRQQQTIAQLAARLHF
jgi:hypothetical protein